MYYRISSTSLVASVNGQTFSLTSDHPHFSMLRDALIHFNADIDDAGALVAMFDKAGAMEAFMEKEVEARGGVLYFQGEEVHNFVATRIADFMERRLPYQPLVEFLKRLRNNPSKHSVEEAYKFIEANKLPITEDGYVLGYKGVDSEFKDGYTHTVDNSIGAKVSCPRNQVDDNWRVQCSSGFHVGSLEYATTFAKSSGRDGELGHVVIVKVDPADIVAVPESESDWKMRVCGYEVVQECEGALPQTVAVSDQPYATENIVLGMLKKFFGIK